MWTIVYMAPNEDSANKIKNLLSSEGILVKLKKTSKGKNQEQSFYEIQVPNGEVNESYNIITENGFKIVNNE